jgi:hypothetical protein
VDSEILDGRTIARACRTAVLIPVLMVLAGCGNWIMRADFDNYVPNTSGSLLEGPILGKPDGDRIDDVCVGGDVRVQQGSPVNSLLIDQCISGVVFVPADHDLPKAYAMNWNGTVEKPENSFPTFITLRFEEGPILLRFLSGKLEILRNGTPQTDPITAGSLTSHTLEIELTTGSGGQFELTYQETGSAGTGPKIVRSMSAGNLGRLESIVINQTGDFSAYVISDLDVFARD